MKWPVEELNTEEITQRLSLREGLGDLDTLTESIKRLGLLNPIVVDRDGVLVSGARRLAACREAGLESIPARRLDITFDSMAALDIQSDENLCRLPLACDDLERHIANKKARLTGKPPNRAGLLRKAKGLVLRTPGSD